MPVRLGNDVDVATVAEFELGAARAYRSLLGVFWGTGVGGGVVLDGRLWYGRGAAGEIGYLPIFDDDAGRDGLGPFEHAAGGTAFARLGRRAAAAGESPALLELAGGDPDAIDAEVVFKAADSGDETAQRILDELLHRLARGIASAVTVLNPSTVIVGGGVSRAGNKMLEPLERSFARNLPLASVETAGTSWNPVSRVCSPLSPPATAVVAITLATATTATAPAM